MRGYLSMLSFLVVIFTCRASAYPDQLKIALITDIHFLSPQLVCKGDALYAYEEATGRNVGDLHEVLNKVVDELKDVAPDILLIAGDITNNGEQQSHIDFIDKLKPLQDEGTRVFVIPGNHDVNVPDAKAYKGMDPTPVKSVSRKEFAELYALFGYGGALKRDDVSLSYLAEINETTWLLCLDTNRYDESSKSSITGGTIRTQTLDWALDIVREAREKNIRILGMMHHGLVEHFPYQAAFFPNYLVKDWQKNADLLADAGLNVVFTGHFHSNDITLRVTSAGNTIYDVETASLAQYPFAYRIMLLGNKDISIDTRFISSVPENPSLGKEYRQKLERITRRVVFGRLNRIGLPMSCEMKQTITDLIVKMNLLHVRGDEMPDMEMMTAVRDFAILMEGEADINSFAFDFPPEDNNVVIELFKEIE